MFTYSDVNDEWLWHLEHAEGLVLLLHPANGNLDGGPGRHFRDVNFVGVLVIDVNIYGLGESVQVLG